MVSTACFKSLPEDTPDDSFAFFSIHNKLTSLRRENNAHGLDNQLEVCPN